MESAFSQGYAQILHLQNRISLLDLHDPGLAQILIEHIVSRSIIDFTGPRGRRRQSIEKLSFAQRTGEKVRRYLALGINHRSRRVRKIGSLWNRQSHMGGSIHYTFVITQLKAGQFRSGYPLLHLVTEAFHAAQPRFHLLCIQKITFSVFILHIAFHRFLERFYCIKFLGLSIGRNLISRYKKPESIISQIIHHRLIGRLIAAYLHLSVIHCLLNFIQYNNHPIPACNDIRSRI